MCEPVEVKNAPLWAHLPPWVTQGFSRASDETRTGIAPSFFARETDEGKKGKAEDEQKMVGHRDRAPCRRVFYGGNGEVQGDFVSGGRAY